VEIEISIRPLVQLQHVLVQRRQGLIVHPKLVVVRLMVANGQRIRQLVTTNVNRKLLSSTTTMLVHFHPAECRR
jgi:hypothetical protein